MVTGEGSCAGTLDLLDEVGHSHHTVDVTTVIAEEDTAERGKSTHAVCLDGDRSFDPVRVGRALDNDSTTSHVEGVFFFGQQ